MLADIADGHFTTEVGAFNLELNLDPQVFTGDCLRLLEAQLDQLLAVARAVAAGRSVCDVVLAGILPTIRKGDLSMENMVQNPRYLALNTALMSLRGEAYELHIKGTDELRVRQDSVMAEACNASFQVHLQVTPDEFVNLYNIAQLLAGPVLACATNSPVLFGKRLWAETRIALFEQSVDTRRPGPHIRDRSARVTFGNDWVEHVDHRAVPGGHHALPAGARARRLRGPVRRAGRRPRSDARRRCGCTRARCGAGTAAATASPTACRTCASRTGCCRPGPTVVDEVANAALWLGLMRALGARHPEVNRMLPFEDARAELRVRRPPGAGRPADVARRDRAVGRRPSRSTCCCRWPPRASTRSVSPSDDRSRYLGVIERRVRSGHTGLALGARLARRDAQPGHGRASA